MTKTVLLDVDGVLANFIGGVLPLVHRVTGTWHSPEAVTHFDFSASLGLSSDHKRRVMEYVSGDEPGFWERLEPFEGARAGVDALRAIPDVELYIVTSPWNSCRTWLHDRESWLKRHFDIPHSHVIVGSAKHMVTGDFFVDDKTETLVRWRDRNGRTGTAIQWETPHNLLDGWNGPCARSWPHLVQMIGEAFPASPGFRGYELSEGAPY